MNKKKILFLHGFFASGQCDIAGTLRKELFGKADVICPDLPLHPNEALSMIRRICDDERPDLLVGNSCGAFYAQMLAPIVGIPALLGNPYFQMTEFLKTRIGEHEYKSARADGKQNFRIDEALICEFSVLEQQQFNYCNPYYHDKVWGIFGDADTLAHYEPLFLKHYSHSYHFPGAHTPTATEVAKYYVPLAIQILQTIHRSNGPRYFRHFKGGLYRYMHTAFDSETLERMVVYQALYGSHQYWVRSEKMFFENVLRNGVLISRFTEIDNPQ